MDIGPSRPGNGLRWNEEAVAKHLFVGAPRPSAQAQWPAVGYSAPMACSARLTSTTPSGGNGVCGAMGSPTA
jgi:hypothetical protein